MTARTLELINEFGKVAGYKINTQKSVAFLYTNNERSERKKYPIYHHIKKNKIPQNKPTKGGKDLYLENNKIHLKEIKGDTNRWRARPCSWIGRRIL